MAVTEVGMTEEQLTAVNAGLKMLRALNAVPDEWATQCDTQPYGQVHNTLIQMLTDAIGPKFADTFMAVWAETLEDAKSVERYTIHRLIYDGR